MKRGVYQNCKTCGKEFYVRPYEIKLGTRMYCSLKCKGAGRDIAGKNNPRWAGGLPKCVDCGKTLSMVGYKRCGNCSRKNLNGEKSGRWKGDDVSYRSLHQWLRRLLGKSEECQFCGSTKFVQFANIDHKYERKLGSYIELCRKCHIKFDIEHNNYKCHVENLGKYAIKKTGCVIINKDDKKAMSGM